MPIIGNGHSYVILMGQVGANLGFFSLNTQNADSITFPLSSRMDTGTPKTVLGRGDKAKGWSYVPLDLQVSGSDSRGISPYVDRSIGLFFGTEEMISEDKIERSPKLTPFHQYDKSGRGYRVVSYFGGEEGEEGSYWSNWIIPTSSGKIDLSLPLGLEIEGLEDNLELEWHWGLLPDAIGSYPLLLEDRVADKVISLNEEKGYKFRNEVHTKDHQAKERKGG